MSEQRHEWGRAFEYGSWYWRCGRCQRRSRIRHHQGRCVAVPPVSTLEITSPIALPNEGDAITITGLGYDGTFVVKAVDSTYRGARLTLQRLDAPPQPSLRQSPSRPG